MTAPPAAGRSAPHSPRHIVGETRVSIAGALAGHRNSLGVIRLVLASAVIFAHAYPLGGFGAGPWLTYTNNQVSLGSLAVLGFFAISGYLITKSGLNADVLQYLWRRVLRIFPAFWVVLLIGAFVVGPLVWVANGQPLANYFSRVPGNPFAYVMANWDLSIGAYGVRDVFAATTPYGNEVGGSVLNGSIWTLIYEWNCYLIIGAAVALGVLRRARVLIPVVTAVMLVVQALYQTDRGALVALAPILADRELINLTLTFMLGATLAVYSQRVVFSNVLGVGAGALTLATLHFGGFLTIGLVAGTYFIMYLAARLPRRLQWIGTKNDYSYGVYIYGFLVQQTVAFFGGHRLGYLPFALIALIISLGLAWLSWHIVEKRAMALKSWGPGRGLDYWLEAVRAGRVKR